MELSAKSPQLEQPTKRLTPAELQLFTNKLIERTETDPEKITALTEPPPQSVKDYKVYLKARSEWWLEHFEFPFSNIQARTKLIIETFPEEFKDRAPLEQPVTTVPAKKLEKPIPEKKSEPRSIKLTKEQKFLAHVDNTLADIEKNEQTGDFVVDLENQVNPTIAAPLQRLLFTALTQKNKQVAARIRKVYDERFTDQREGVLAFFEFLHWVQIQDNRMERERANFFKDCTEAMFLISHFVDLHSDDPKLLKTFWKTLSSMCHAMGSMEQFRKSKSGIVATVATRKLLQEVGETPLRSLPREDADHGIDLWIDEQSAVQIKGVNDGPPEFCNVTSGIPVLKKPGEGTDYEDSEKKKFAKRVARYSTDSHLHLDAYWIQIPRDYYDFYTGVPTPDAVRWMKDIFPTVYKPRTKKTKKVRKDEKFVEPVRELKIIAESHEIPRPAEKPKEIEIVAESAKDAFKNFFLINYEYFEKSRSALDRFFLEGTLPNAFWEILLPQVVTFLKRIDPELTRDNVISWVEDVYSHDEVVMRQARGYADVAAFGPHVGTFEDVPTVTPSMLINYFLKHKKMFQSSEKEWIHNFIQKKDKTDNDVRYVQRIVSEHILKNRYRMIPQNHKAIVARILSTEYRKPL